MQQQVITTEQGDVAVSRSESRGPTILMIHGNSSCKEVFRNQLNGDIGKQFRCIALDLPGHGRSSNSRTPDSTYTMPGYADVALEVMRKLECDNYVVLGWSLGGHIGIEMLNKSSTVERLMITGTPPVGHGEEAVGAGFLPSDHVALAAQRKHTAAESEAFARATCGINAPYEDFLGVAVARTDGRAREIMFNAFITGSGCDQRQVVEQSSVPLAIVNGAKDPFINNDYLRSVPYGNLWEDTVHLLPDVGHAPFWEAPKVFDSYLARFMSSKD